MLHCQSLDYDSINKTGHRDQVDTVLNFINCEEASSMLFQQRSY